MCVGGTKHEYNAKWGNINGSRGRLDLTILKCGRKVVKTIVNSVDPEMKHSTAVPGHGTYVCSEDAAGYIYNFKFSVDFLNVNGHSSRSHIEYAGPGTPDAVGIFGVVYGTRA